MKTLLLKKYGKLAALCASALCLVAVGAHAAIVNINFEGTGYEAGEPLPAPWNVTGSGSALVQDGVGYGGGQGLVSTSTTMEYDLAEPLTSAMGAVQM